ncbi:helicase-associated domain-containing protein [Dictyobacter formicarum]|uniref:helicase-associated domain-containing protein n=1 Tax=Dictyobacter formicarum TaxID=2778368 RepID=UPI0019164BF5|nr:helicase-associated domain-containing protein [Dictyobacter formicarum]
MENGVPGALQRLRAADILRMAGLTAASLGQEYNRTGTIRGTQRQGARLHGIVELPPGIDPLESAVDGQDVAIQDITTTPRSYTVEVELTSATSWRNSCSCGESGELLCAHGAALLYRWLAQPAIFEPRIKPPAPQEKPTNRPAPAAPKPPLVRETLKADNLPNPPVSSAIRYSPDLVNILVQIGLGELRSIAREYNLTTNGLSKQQLAEQIVEAIKQPDVVRRVATTLEKPQRQLLAALSLAGGLVHDDDLRGLFERFSLGQAAQLQRALLALQGKALLFRVNSFNADLLARNNSPSNLLDIGWFVPTEIRTALRIFVPVTSFDPEQPDEHSVLPHVQSLPPMRILADLLLVARALDGMQVEPDDSWFPTMMAESEFPTVHVNSPGMGHTALLSQPNELPSAALLTALQKKVSFAPSFLRFATQILLLAGIVQRPERETPYLRILPDAARLLLGSNHADVLSDLFKLWLQSPSATELFALQEDGLRLLCRMTPLNVPVLRVGELAEENMEARQALTDLLAQAPIGQWMQFTAFSRFVYRLNPLLLQRRQRLLPAPHWWLEADADKALKPQHLGDWQRAELLYVARLITGPFHWWGLCDVALSSQGRLLAFRMTALARWLLHDVPLDLDKVQEFTQETLEVLEDGQVLLPCSARYWPIIQLFEQCAEATGVERSQLRYRFTPQALSQALSQGYQMTRLLEVLRQAVARAGQSDGSGAQLLARLERWLASYGRVRIYTGVTVVETIDTTVMRELMATTSLDEYVIRPLHPTIVVVKPTATERLSDELKRRGQSPLIHDEDLYGPE